MSALPPEADIRQRIEHVCFVPNPDSCPQQTVRLPNQLGGKRERLGGSSNALRLCRLRLMVSSNLPRLTH